MPEESDETLTDETPLLRSPKDQTNSSEQALGNSPDPGKPTTEDDTLLVGEPSTGKLVFVLGSIWLGCFLAALDSTIIATLSAPISASFNSLSLLSWLASSYFIANAALQPLSGRFTDILSRRTGLVFSNVCFAAGNLICGLATTEAVMITGRVVAGMGGGGLTAISTFVASDLVPLRKRGLWQGYGNLCYGIGAGLGGVFGGWVNDAWGWRAAFLAQVPLTVISGIWVFFAVKIPVKESSQSKWRRIDLLGAVTLVATLVLLLLGVNSGGNIVPWSHPLVLTTIPLSVVSLLAFIYVEHEYASEPVIPVKLLLDRTVLSACLTNWFTTMSTFALIFYGPIYFQVQGMSTTEAGVRLIPQSLGVGIGSLGSGIIMRITGRYYWLSFIIQIIYIAALVLVSTFQLDTPYWEPFLALFFSGLGYASMLTITLLALIAAVDHKHQAVITSASYAFRSTGSAIGITIASAVFQNILKIELWKNFGEKHDAQKIIKRLRDSLEEIGNLPKEWQGDARAAYMGALRGFFLTTVGIGCLGLVISLFMREHVLHTNLARK